MHDNVVTLMVAFDIGNSLNAGIRYVAAIMYGNKLVLCEIMGMSRIALRQSIPLEAE